MRILFISLVILFGFSAVLNAGDAGSFTYLDQCQPYAPSGSFPKLITPQWIGDEKTEAVVILAIDDLSDPPKYEAYMRPIINRLKKIDGRAPISVMTNRPNWNHSQLTQWLEEGLSIDVHTVDHPCPLFHGNDFEKAKSTYDRCVDLLSKIPGNKPEAFRMPCCDSQNTVSPRFYSEIFNKTTPSGKFLQASSSVFMTYTPEASQKAGIPEDLIVDEGGKSKFEKYLPNQSQFGNIFLNYIKDYPYPYVIDRLCWEFPSIVPSDWSAQHYHKPNNPVTLADFKAGLDITFQKKGVMTMTFHPHGWIENQQMVELVDYADKKYGDRIRFLTFPEALKKMNENMLDGHPLRNEEGKDNGVRILDLNGDGFMDVLYFEEDQSGKKPLITKLWKPEENRWKRFSSDVLEKSDTLKNAHFGTLGKNGNASMLLVSKKPDGEPLLRLFTLDSGNWNKEPDFSESDYADISELDAFPTDIISKGIRFRDIDHDGRSEILIGIQNFIKVLGMRGETKKWGKLPYSLPGVTTICNDSGFDQGLRFIDINSDGKDDVIFSNHNEFSLHLYVDSQTGWSRELLSGKRGSGKPEEEIPMIVREKGANNGAWFADGFMWVQNEDTSSLPDYVDRRSFADWLKK